MLCILTSYNSSHLIKELLAFDGKELSESLRKRTRIRPEEAVFGIMKGSSDGNVSHHYTQGDSLVSLRTNSSSWLLVAS